MGPNYAEIAYNVYAEAVGRKTHNGRRPPAWNFLPSGEQEMWRAIAQSALDAQPKPAPVPAAKGKKK